MGDMNASFRGENIRQNEVQTAAENGGNHLKSPRNYIQNGRNHYYTNYSINTLRIHKILSKKSKSHVHLRIQIRIIKIIQKISPRQTTENPPKRIFSKYTSLMSIKDFLHPFHISPITPKFLLQPMSQILTLRLAPLLSSLSESFLTTLFSQILRITLSPFGQEIKKIHDPTSSKMRNTKPIPYKCHQFLPIFIHYIRTPSRP